MFTSMKKSYSFRTKLIASILFIVAALLLCTITIISSMVNWEVSHLNENFTKSAFMKTDAELTVMTEELNRDFSRLSSEIGKYVLNLGKSQKLSYIKDKIKIGQVFDRYTNYDLICLITGSNAIISSPGRHFMDTEASEELFKGKLFQGLVDPKEKYGCASLAEFTGYTESANWQDTDIIYFTKKFYSQRKSYTLVIGLRESQIHQTFLQLEQKVNKVYLLNGNGIVLSSSHSAERGSRLGYYKNNMPLSFNRQLDSEEYQIMSYPLSNYGWTILSQYPTSEYRSNINKVTTQIFLVSSVCIVLMGIVIYAIVRRLSAPLYALSRRLQRFSMDGKEMEPPEKTYLLELDILNENFSKMTHDIAELMRIQAEEHKKKNQLRMQALMAQINPHFMSNTLNIAKSMAEFSGSDNVAVLLQHICGYISPAFRVAKNRWTYGEEYTFLKDYIYILEIRFAANLKIRTNFAPELRDAYVPRFLVQPLIENCVFHGMEQRKTLEIDVSIQKSHSGQVLLSVHDNGSGMSESILAEKQQMLLDYNEEAPVEHEKRIGMFNVKQRLSIYYPQSHSFTIWSEPGKGTKIDITIPFA